MSDSTRKRLLSDGVESRPVFVDSDNVTARQLDRLEDFVYVRSNIPGPGSDLVQWEEDIAGCDCSGPGGDGDCGTSCPCVRLFGEAYRDRKLISKDMEIGKDGRRTNENHSVMNSSKCLQRPILECGSNCSCFGGAGVGDGGSALESAPGCANSVVGAGITFPFIVFFDDRKGFGLKCSEMIPRGSFLCEYAGEVIGEKEARKRLLTKRRKEEEERLEKRRREVEEEEERHLLCTKDSTQPVQGDAVEKIDHVKSVQPKRKENTEIIEGGSGSGGGGGGGEISVDVLPEMDSITANRSRKGGKSMKSLAESMNYIIVLTEEIVDDAMTKDCDDGDGNGDGGRSSKRRRKDWRSRRTIVDAENYSNVGHFINHSCLPNLVMMPVRISRDVPRLSLFALRDIPPMEELTFHYGGESGKGHGGDPIMGLGGVVCLCGSPNCEGTMPYDGQLFEGL